MDWKALAKKLAFPPVWLMLLLTVFSAAALAMVFVRGAAESPIAYIVYVVSFYTVCVISIFCGMVLPRRYRAIRERVYANPIGNRYLTDAAFKTHVSLYASLAANLLYAAVNVAFWFLNRSMWFVILAGYYGILAVMRFLLLRYVRGNKLGTNRLGELKSARICSWILLSVNFVLSGAVLMILYQNRGFEYYGVLIYVMAGYTFYITTHAVMDLVKYRKYKSPVMTVSKVIALSAALVSMLSLETAMFSQFGADMAPQSKWIMVALTGAGVSAVVVAMSVYMIRKCAKEIKEIKKNG